MRPIEFFRGTPAERSVLSDAATIRSTGKTSFTRTESQAIRDANAIRGTLSRRRLIGGAIGAATAIAVGGFEAYPYLRDEGYQGPIEDMQSIPLLSQDKINRFSDMLYETRSPLLQKAAEGIKVLTTTTTNPAPNEFPEWVIQPDSFPLPITQTDDTDTSNAFSLSEVDTSKAFWFFPSPTAQPIEFPYLTPYHMGIKLGTGGIELSTQDRRDFAWSTLLAKEYITLMLKTGCVTNASSFFDATGMQVTDTNGNQLRNEERTKAAASAFNIFVNDESRAQWAVIDSTPILMLQQAFNDGKARGGYISDVLFDSFEMYVQNYLNDGVIANNVQMVNDRWAEALNRFVPHDTVAFDVFNEQAPIYEATISLASTLYGKTFK